MSAYYNEFDPYAAQWLRNLINAGLIAPGDVDERDLNDVHPDDLRPYTQVHLCAGIAVWSRGLRNIGWPDDAPIWSASLPCQPFSAAGKGLGFVDERHLWPTGYHLITQLRPKRIVGEQVASKDGLAWLDLVQTDMERAGYAFGAVDFCAASVGAPHIRQRTYWMADADGERRDGEQVCLQPGQPRQAGSKIAGDGGSSLVANTNSDGQRERRGNGEHSGGQSWPQPIHGYAGGGVADTENLRHEGQHIRSDGEPAQRVTEGSTSGGRAGPTNGQWRDADWLFCRDGKWRPVEPGTFPLAHAWNLGNRVGMLRAAGNAINIAQAEAFLAAALGE